MVGWWKLVPEILLWPAAIALAAGFAWLLYQLVEKWETVITFTKKNVLYAGAGLLIIVLFWLMYLWIDFPAIPEPSEQAKNKIDAIKTVAQILGGVILIYGVYLTLRRIRAIEKQVQISEDGQVTDRFTKAIEQLGSNQMEVRLGGIYALECIAHDSDKDYWTIMEVLTAYVRERAPWQEDEQDASQPEKIEPPTDIQAVLTVLGRRRKQFRQRDNFSIVDT
ncbi:hypothetical protein [Desulfobacca acetoxidans]